MANAHSKDSAVFLDLADVTSYTTSFEYNQTRNLPEITTLGDSTRKYFEGLHEPTATIEFLWDETAVEGSDTILATVGTATAAGADDATNILTYYPKGDAIGNFGYTGNAANLNSQTTRTALDDMVRVTATFNVANIRTETDPTTAGALARIKSTGTKATVTATTNGTTIDDGASSSSGAIVTIHIFAFTASGGSARWLAELHHSSDGASWADFSSNAITGTGSTQTFTVAGTLNRYVRGSVTLDASSGSLTYHIGYQRL